MYENLSEDASQPAAQGSIPLLNARILEVDGNIVGGWRIPETGDDSHGYGTGAAASCRPALKRVCSRVLLGSAIVEGICCDRIAECPGLLMSGSTFRIHHAEHFYR